jgi:hypothetical protein
MRTKPFLPALAVILGIAGTSAVLAQTPVAQNRVAQPVLINGVKVDAAYVLAAGGGIQSYTCPAPQQYATPDGASQGWACFDAATNVWLLSALPPQQQAPAPAPVAAPVIQQPVYAPVYQQPVIYEVAPPPIIYREPRVIYAPPVYYPRPYYSPSVAVGVASINAASRIAAAVIESSRFHDNHRSIRIIESHGRRR